MLAIACDHFKVLVVDTDTKRIVRIFRGHSGRVTDMVSTHTHILLHACPVVLHTVAIGYKKI